MIEIWVDLDLAYEAYPACLVFRRHCPRIAKIVERVGDQYAFRFFDGETRPSLPEGLKILLISKKKKIGHFSLKNTIVVCDDCIVGKRGKRSAAARSITRIETFFGSPLRLSAA
ncbi:MAG TPA: hypothetical protein VJB99_01045 [Patescibacteria group bacterium]|nr:hypothetical protein [Patescibacteria group bacterium]